MPPFAAAGGAARGRAAHGGDEDSGVHSTISATAPAQAADSAQDREPAGSVVPPWPVRLAGGIRARAATTRWLPRRRRSAPPAEGRVGFVWVRGPSPRASRAAGGSLLATR